MDEFQSLEASWWIGFIVSCLCLIISVVLLVSIIKKLQTVDATTNKSLLPFTKCSALFSATLCVLCILFYFISFPICKRIYCGYNTWGMVTYLTTLNSYILAKICLYSLFIGRLYNEFFKQLTKGLYSNAIFYSLSFMMLLAWFVLIVINILVSIDYVDEDEDAQKINTVAVIMFVLLDFSLSVFTLVLFIIPLCSRYGHKLKLSIIKYTVLSSIAILSSSICGILMVIRYYHEWYHPFLYMEVEYLDILNSLKCVDCVISLFCIYFGFVSKETYTRHCGMCTNCFLNLLKSQWRNTDAIYEVYLMNANQMKHEQGGPRLFLSTSPDEVKTEMEDTPTITTAVSSTD